MYKHIDSYKPASVPEDAKTLSRDVCSHRLKLDASYSCECLKAAAAWLGGPGVSDGIPRYRKLNNNRGPEPPEGIEPTVDMLVNIPGRFT
jgi:hypothetical protein